jgi:hypothetical protein
MSYKTPLAGPGLPFIGKNRPKSTWNFTDYMVLYNRRGVCFAVQETTTPSVVI